MTQVSPLRRRMIDDMTVRNLSPATQRSYVHAVAKFGPTQVATSTIRGTPSPLDRLRLEVTPPS